MKQFLITVAGVLVALILFVIVTPIALVATFAGRETGPVVPPTAVLSIDLREPLPDQPQQGLFFEPTISTIEFVRRLESAKADDRIKGVFVRGNVWGLPAAQAEEIRTALNGFRESGKFVVASLQVEGLTTSIPGYAAVAGADELWLAQSGGLMAMGAVSEQIFLGETLRRFSIAADFETREEFKSAADTFTRSGFTPADREQTLALLNGVVDTMIAHIAADRDLAIEAVRATIERTPMSAEAAVSAKFADKIGQPEDAEAAALARAGEEAELLPIEDYQPQPPRGPVIALIGGEGPIVSGPADSSPFGGDASMNSDVISQAFAEAVEDEDVRAIVFRVSSPGGTIVGSEQIGAALARARAAGKIVVVSMGDVAASGGYWVSAHADSIVASPSTITGSIGVVGGKFVIGPALDRYLSARTEEIAVGSPMVNAFTGSRAFTNAEREFFVRYIDQGYSDFLSHVATGRDMPVERVREIAKGRVWTGAQAKELGLVDALGGLNVAIDRAKELAEITDEDRVALKLFPAQPSPVEQLRELFGVSASAARGAAALSVLMGDERLNAALRAAARARDPGLSAESGVAPVR